MFNPLTQNARFSLYYLPATGITVFGNGIHYIAMVWLVYEETQSIASISLLLGLSFISRAIGACFAGKWVDRYDKCKVAILSDISRLLAIVPLVLIISIETIKSPIVYIFIVEFFLSIASPFFMVAIASLIKIHVTSNYIFTLFRAKELVMQIGLILGTGISGFIIAYLDIRIAFILNALTYLSSAILIHKVSKIFTIRNHQINNKTPNVKQYRILKIVRKNMRILSLIILSILISAPALIFDNVLADYVSTYLKSDEKLFGIIDSSYAIGSLLAIFGASVISTLSKKVIINYFIIFLLGIVFILFGVISNTILIILLSSIAGLIGISLKVVIQTLIQTYTKIEDIGRIQAFSLLLQNISAVTILALVGLLNSTITTQMLLIYCGIFTIILSVPFAYVLEQPKEQCQYSKGDI